MAARQMPGLARGLRPGLIGDVAALHGRFYAREWHFPVAFEAMVAREMAAFALRYEDARDLILSVEGADGHVAGTITLDVSDPALPAGQGHVRWFILADRLKGQGMGALLLGEVLGFARATGLSSLYLTTFRGLDAAAGLYAKAGFVLVDERPGDTWGRTVMEQRLERRL